MRKHNPAWTISVAKATTRAIATIVLVWRISWGLCVCVLGGGGGGGHVAGVISLRTRLSCLAQVIQILDEHTYSSVFCSLP